MYNEPDSIWSGYYGLIADDNKSGEIAEPKRLHRAQGENILSMQTLLVAYAGDTLVALKLHSYGARNVSLSPGEPAHLSDGYTSDVYRLVLFRREDLEATYGMEVSEYMGLKAVGGVIWGGDEAYNSVMHNLEIALNSTEMPYFQWFVARFPGNVIHFNRPERADEPSHRRNPLEKLKYGYFEVSADVWERLRSSHSPVAQIVATEGGNYKRLSVGVDVAQPVWSGHGAAAMSTHNLFGLGASYVYGIDITGHRLPLYLEVGGECSYVHRTEEIDYWEDVVLSLHEELNTQLLTLSAPIDLAYHLRLNDAWVLAPAAGVTAKANLLAQVSGSGETVNRFDAGAHRFQLGWNVACGAYFHRLYLGMRYSADLTAFQSERGVSERFWGVMWTVGMVY